MVMQAMRGEGKFGGALKYVLFTFLGMAVGGLVLGSFSGGGNVSSNDVAKINGKAIKIQSFDRALQRSISRYGMSRQQAYKLGLVDEVLSGEIRGYFLLNEAERLGIEIGKDQLSNRIAKIIKPYTKDGQTMQEVLNDILKRQGMSEKEFISEIKKEVSGDILVNAIKTGFSPNTDLLAKDLYSFQMQTRDVDLILFPDARIDNLDPATTEQLERLYNAVKSKKYKIPEYRSIEVATFDPKDIDIDFSVSKEEVRKAYDDNPNNFRVGEQFVLSQIVTKDEKQAGDIYALIEKGNDLKTAAVTIMGDDGTYIENVNFEVTMMLPDLMEPLKDREIGKIVPPTKTMLGYHIVKLENILQPSIRPYNEVYSTIKKELLDAKKSDYLYDLSSEFDSMLSDEMSLQEIAKEMKLTISTIDFIDINGLNKQGEDGLDSFDARDKEAIAEIVFDIEDNIASSMQDFDGKLVSLAVTSKEPSTYKSFDSVENELAEQFMADQRELENGILMSKYLAEISTKGSTFESIAKDSNLEIETIKAISLNGDTKTILPPSSLPKIFKTAFGGHETIRLDGQSALIKISGYGYNSMGEQDEQNISDIKTKIDDEGKNEALLMYLQALSKQYPAKINNQLLERAYGDKDDES